MSISIKVFFIKKIENKKEEWFYELKPKSKSKFIYDHIKFVMINLQKSYEYIKKTEQGFVKYKHMDIFFKGKNIYTLHTKRATKENLINIDYLLKIKWDELSKQDLCKTIVINFPSILWQVDDALSRLVRNYANENPFELSNGQKLNQFDFKIREVNVISDPLFIKKSVYKTPVRYKGT